ncbi:hypothetical protein BD779DRAFT_1507546 [Infundibulicybe gibba]|nr:hypothetical protein BD779DRAFT_1507546 [Infundibulicybe gibba]
MSTTQTPSEDILGKKRYSGVGFGAGVVASVIFFRRRTWPIALSTGFGAGAAYADCDRSFNPARIPGTRIIPHTQQHTQTQTQGRRVEQLYLKTDTE